MKNDINIAGKAAMFIALLCVAVYLAAPPAVHASDPPHRSDSDPNWCANCHKQHNAPGGDVTAAEGNPNLCMSCHNVAGIAKNKPFASADLAVPGTSGISHRWDSGPAGYVTSGGTNTSTGKVISGLVVSGGQPAYFTGQSVRLYEIKITSQGDVSSAAFDWKYSDDDGSAWTVGGSGVLTGQGIVLNDNLKMLFVNGCTSIPCSPASFILNDTWTIKVRPGITFPATLDLSKRMFKDPNAPYDIPDMDTGIGVVQGSTYGKVVCSTCHNQHLQTNAPLDPLAPSTYAGAGTSAGRHFQRITNSSNQMCLDCHSPRRINSVRTWTGSRLSHPVEVAFPSSNTPTHSVPKEPGGAAAQSSKTVSGSATSAGSTTTLADTSKSWADNELVGMTVTFTCWCANASCANTSCVNKGEQRQITTNTANQITWASALPNAVSQNDRYTIDADGNPTNNFRYDDNGTPSFTQGKVLCMSCHSPHWADSNQNTYDGL
ncbi:MAG: hypothetical protein HY886_01345 [Deltaproteobacteria bacterium]|nr:hypothetical protein [Deltaproteobacteria bacterium]